MSQFNLNKIDAIGSTNQALREQFQAGQLQHGQVLWALHQTQGKGQRGAVWSVEANKNLTFSVFLSQEKLSFSKPFSLNCHVALALKSSLDALDIPDVSIKWPNDILSGEEKICGILIENVYRGKLLKGSIVGVGLNVNQEKFDHLPQASSMRLQTGRTFVIEEVLQLFLKHFSSQLQNNNEGDLFEHYRAALFSIDQNRNFRTGETQFSATIKGVNENGQLLLQLSDGSIKEFALKEIQWVY